MLIYANKHKNDAADLILFFYQKKCNYLSNYKNYLPEILRR